MADNTPNDAGYHQSRRTHRRMCGSSSSSEIRPFHVGRSPYRVPEIYVPTEPPLIPGPAGSIQQAFRRRTQNRENFPSEIENEPNTQQYIAQVLSEPAPFDTDFNQPNWTSAIEFATKQGYMLTDNPDAIWTSINAIHKSRGTWEKFDKMVCLVHSLTPNGLGDALVTLKDPSGTIDCSIHRKVFENEAYGNSIGVGAVLFLRKCTVITQLSRTKYINITAKNIGGIIAKNDIITNTEGNGEEMSIEEEENLLLSSVVPDSEDEM